ncbi:MAG: relaxase domain-containing protein [Actinomycetota bacterium]|nr:relaxase domain-containing protein [Actinomycetota bacterium]
MAVLFALAPDADFFYLTAEPRALAGAWGGESSWEPRLLAAVRTEGLGFDPAGISARLGESSAAFRAAWVAAKRGSRFLEMVVAAPKSVSLLAALGTDQERCLVVASHRAAVAEVHGRVARELLWSRVTAAEGREYHRAPGVEAAEFVHFLSRRLDPHLHSHLLVPNVAIGADGKTRSIDSQTLKFASPHLDLLYLAALERNLADRGLGWTVPTNRIAARARQLAESGVFSLRRDEVVREMQTTGSGSRIARLRTRPSKPAEIAVEAVADEWSARAALLRGDTEEQVGGPFLGIEMASLESRIAAAAQSRGAGILDVELRGLGAANLDGGRPLDYADVVLDDVLGGRATGTGFASPPPLQRSYRRQDLQLIAARLRDVHPGSTDVPGRVFRLARGADQLFELEAAMLGAAKAGAETVASNLDSALGWRAVGKPAAASLTRLSPGDAIPRGAALMLSQATDPADVATLLGAGAGAGGVLLADAARLDPATGEPVGRGAGWRSWIARQLEPGVSVQRTEFDRSAGALSLALGPRLMVYENSESLRSALAVRAAAGEDLLVADQRLAPKGVRVLGGTGARSRLGPPPPGSPEAELAGDGSLAQAVSRRRDADVYMMAAPIAPPSRVEDRRLVQRVLNLAALRLPAFAAGHLACADLPEGREEIGARELSAENLATLARLGPEPGPWGGANDWRTDRLGAMVSRLLLSPLGVPGLDGGEEPMHRVPQRLFAILELMDADRDVTGRAAHPKDLRPWLVSRARTLVALEVERRLEVEPVIGLDRARPGIELGLGPGEGFVERVREVGGRGL